MVYRFGLENRWVLTGPVSSNLTASASFKEEKETMESFKIVKLHDPAQEICAYKRGRQIFRPGDTVRLIGRKRTAKIQRFSNESEGSVLEGAVFLDKPLSGSRWWNISALEKC